MHATHSRHFRVNQECLADAYRMVTGCATDFYSVATQARSDVLSRARTNPMVYLQPTSTTIISAAQEVLQVRFLLSSSALYPCPPFLSEAPSRSPHSKMRSEQNETLELTTLNFEY